MNCTVEVQICIHFNCKTNTGEIRVCCFRVGRRPGVGRWGVGPARREVVVLFDGAGFGSGGTAGELVLRRAHCRRHALLCHLLLDLADHSERIRAVALVSGSIRPALRLATTSRSGLLLAVQALLFSSERSEPHCMTRSASLSQRIGVLHRNE